MKGQKFVCLFFFVIITYRAVSYSPGSDLQMDAKQLKDVNVVEVGLGKEGNEKVYNKEVLQETIHKGKGSYGGGDLLRQHRSPSAATYSFLVRPFLSTLGLIMMGYLMLVGFF